MLLKIVRKVKIYEKIINRGVGVTNSRWRGRKGVTKNAKINT